MRRAIALEKGEDDVWDLKYAAGGMVDIDFIAQYLQLVHAADKPDILDVSTLAGARQRRAARRAAAIGGARCLRSATRLYHDLTQILRLCVTEKFKPETAGEDLLRVLARAGDTPDFSSLEARVRETQTEVRRVFRVVAGAFGRSARSICRVGSGDAARNEHRAVAGGFGRICPAAAWIS